jgi:hypothetical protein
MTTRRAGAGRQTTRCRAVGPCPWANGGLIDDPGVAEMAKPAADSGRAGMLEHSPLAAAFPIVNSRITITFCRAMGGRRDVRPALVCGAGEIKP